MGELTEQEFKKLADPEVDLEEDKEKISKIFNDCYYNIIDILKEYIELKKEYYNIIALWIIGTYFHEQFYSYPYLFLNAMKGSGKSRTLNLITTLSKGGEMVNSLTEAVLFRTKGTLAIDESEGLERKGKENLRELLNSAYKKGVKIKRMKQVKIENSMEQVVEEFSVYRPIVLANIIGMESVLGDRCIPLILEKSFNKKITNLIEIFGEEKIVKETLKLLHQCSLCSCSFSVERYREWNNYIKYNNTNTTNSHNNTNYTNNILPSNAFKSINLTDLNGREIELSLPLFLIAEQINEEVLKETTLTIEELFKAKKEEDFVENSDVSLIDFVSQMPLNVMESFRTISRLTQEFKEFMQVNEDWINVKWLGRALKRTDLVIEKKRMGHGTEVRLNVLKAQERIKHYK
jgi:hypothetical protein